ncbi:EF hand domain-containing protein, partial [Toxoplasma gondii RUB]
AHDERGHSPGSFGSEGGSHSGAFLSYEGSRMEEERTGSGHDRSVESSGSPDRSEKKAEKRSDEKKTRGSSSGRHGKSKKKHEE